MSIYREKRGPDWGGALQTFAQGLQGYAQQKYQEQRDALERQRQLDDLAEQRKYQEDLWNRQHPMTTIPGRAVDVPAESLPSFGGGFSPELLGLPRGPMFSGPGQRQNENWSPAFTGLEGTQVSTGDFVNLVSDYNANQESFRQQQRRDAAAQAARLEQINAAAANQNQRAADKAAIQADIYGGLPDAKAFNTFATSLVTPEETAFQGLGYQDMVTQELLKMAGEGILLDSAAGVEAERRVRERVTPKFSYLGQELAYEPGAQYDGGSGQWYSPKSYSYSPPQTRPGWIKDKKGELVPLDVAGASATNAQQIQPFKYETMARDIIAPALESGFISIAQLKKVAEQTKTPWEQLSTWIPDAIAKATQAEGLGAAVSRRAIASETSPVEINWDEIN